MVSIEIAIGVKIIGTSIMGIEVAAYSGITGRVGGATCVVIVRTVGLTGSVSIVA